MIIPQERLAAEDVRRVVECVLSDHLKLNIAGYKCDTATVLNVLVKAAIERESIESVCQDMGLTVKSNTIREQVNRVVDERGLRQLEIELNDGLTACIPAALPRTGCEMALDYHDEPFWGKTAELRTYSCGGKAKEGTTRF